MTAPAIHNDSAYSQVTTQQAQRHSADYWGPRLVVLILVTWAAALFLGFQVGLTALIVLGLLSAICGVRCPALGLLGVGMLCTLDAPARNFLLTGGLLRYNTFNYWLLVVILLYVPQLLRFSDPHTRLMQFFVFLLGLELSYVPSVKGIQHVFGIVVSFGLLVYAVRGSRDPQNWYWVGLVNGVLAGVGTCVYYLQQDRLPYFNPNGLAYFPLAALFSICLAMPFARGRKEGQILLLLLAAPNFSWVFLTGSRGGLLTATYTVLFLVVAIRGGARRIAAAAAAALLVIAVLVQFSDLRDRTVARVNRLLDSDYSAAKRTSGRSELMLGGWYIFLDHPWGVGTGNFGATWSNLEVRKGISPSRIGDTTPAHSGWVKVLAENGVPGALLLAAYVLSFTVVGWQKRYQEDMLAFGLLVTGSLTASYVAHELHGKAEWFLATAVTVLFHYQRTIKADTRAAPLGTGAA